MPVYLCVNASRLKNVFSSFTSNILAAVDDDKKNPMMMSKNGKD